MSPLRPEEIIGLLGGIEETQRGFGRGALAGQELMTREQYEDRKRGLEEIVKGEERGDVALLGLIGDDFTVDDRPVTPAEQAEAIKARRIPPEWRREPEVRTAREQRLETREQRLKDQFAYKKAKSARKGNRDLFRLALALASSLRKEWKLEEKGSLEKEILTKKTEDSIKEAIRYARKAGINVREYIEETYTAEPGFIRKILGMTGVKKKRVIERKRLKVRAFATVEAAEAANLPKGTRVTIGGRRAIIE